LNDQVLVEQLRRSDPAAYRELLDRYGQGLFGTAYSMLGNRADAEDALQETLLAACRQIGSFQGRSSLRTWLTSILMNQSARLRRSRAVRKMAPVDESMGASDSGGRGSGGGDVRMDVMASLETLSPEHKEIVVLRELRGHSYDEIAQILGVPRGTVESRLFRARQQLKARLIEYAPHGGAK
jgi:RNA polymerase sigma-70 factor (ECF subfamily)